MKNNKKVTENVAEVAANSESEINSLKANEEISKEEEPVKVKTVMERYATAPSVSHLLILILSLILIAVLITPNIAYIYYNGFLGKDILPFIDFPLHFLDQIDHPAKIAMSGAYEAFNAAFVDNILQVMTHQYKNVYPFIMSCLGGVSILLFAITAIYSFVCVVGGIGRKHTVGLVYTLFAGAFLAFAPAIAMSIISAVSNGPSLYPLFPAIGLLLSIALVIGVHITYCKRIKNTISAKEYAAIEQDSQVNKEEETIKDLSEIKEVKEDSINNRDSIVEEVIRQNKERDFVQEQADANEHLIPEGEEVKSEPVTKPVEEAPVIIEEPKVEEEKPVVEKQEPEVEQEPEVKPEPKKPVPPKPMTIKVAAYENFDPSKGLPELEEGLTELGDHAYSKNLDLEFAIIPEGIEKIGPACFANCLNLKMVQLPSTLQKISFNGFFACKKLTKIVYNGTKVEWKKIVRGSNWLTSAGTKVIICKDGAISVNPFH